MIKNYLKVAIRNFWRDKTFSVINLFGLAIGLATVIIIFAYVKYEFSYDRHYTNADNIYRIDRLEENANELFSTTSNGTAAMLKKEFPQISTYTYAAKKESQFKNKEGLTELTTIDGSADFFKVFNLPFIAGDTRTPLSEPSTIVITKNAAEKFFPGENPIGKTMTTNWGRGYKVTAVIKNIPGNTHIQCDAIISLTGHPNTEVRTSFKNGGVNLPQYILLKPETNVNALANQVKAFYKKYEGAPQASLQLINVKKIHLYSHTYDELSAGSDIKYIYIFSIAGMLILIIAVINYVNLATARSVKRTQEVGIRKVLGAEKGQLVFQFLAESFIFFTIALIFALLLAKICWPFFMEKITRGNSIINLFSLQSVAIIASIAIAGSFFAGMFPAFFLSHIKPALSIKGELKYAVNVNFRKVLVVLQFVISGVLVIATLVVQKQMHFISNSRLGFNKEQLIRLPYDQGWHNDVVAFKNELRQNPAIKSITVSSHDIGANYPNYNTEKQEGPDTLEQAMQYIEADQDFINTMQIDIADGRSFSNKYANDRIGVGDNSSPLSLENRSLIINQSAARQLNLPHPLGQQLVYKGWKQGVIIGVVKDFNMASLHQKIPPMILRSYPDRGTGQLYIRIAPQSIKQTIAFIGTKWKKYYPDDLYSFSFVDDNLQKLYVSEQMMGSLFGVFAIIAISIACFGLFGLVALSVQQRVKEIGIRKVMGAKVQDIVALLSFDFLKLVIVAIIIAVPIAWWGMNKWLQNFAYRAGIEWWVFALSGGAIIFIAIATVSFQTAKAASVNPVKSLRSE